jgi:hypothetical protein
MKKKIKSICFISLKLISISSNSDINSDEDSKKEDRIDL